MAKRDIFGNYVYPKVPRKYWKAVVMACGIIRNHQTFNIAIDRASRRFNVDPVELKRHVVARTQAGCEHSRIIRRESEELSYTKASLVRNRLAKQNVKPKLPRIVKMPQGFCKDCEFCRVDGVLFSDIMRNHQEELRKFKEKFPALRNETIEKINAILSDGSLNNSQKGTKIYQLLGNRVRRISTSWVKLSRERLLEEIDLRLSLEKPTLRGIRPVCTRHSQARINPDEHCLAFPEIPLEKVIEGMIGCGEFELPEPYKEKENGF